MLRHAVLLSLLLPISTFAQEDFWAIPQPSRPAALYHTADSTSERIAILSGDDVLLARSPGKGWCWAQDQQGRQGWVPCASITALTALDDEKALVWMKHVFVRQRQLTQARQSSAVEVPHESLAEPAISATSFEDTVAKYLRHYTAALSLFEPFYCRTGNESLLRELMHTVAIDPRSANEAPPGKLMAALRCRPTDFSTTLRNSPKSEQWPVRQATLNGIALNYDEHDPKRKREGDALRKRVEQPAMITRP